MLVAFLAIFKGPAMIDWFENTLRTYPEIAIFLSLGLGYYFGSFTYNGLGLGLSRRH